MSDDDYGPLNARRQSRMKVIAWVVIIALVLTAGGATVLALILN